MALVTVSRFLDNRPSDSWKKSKEVDILGGNCQGAGVGVVWSWSVCAANIHEYLSGIFYTERPLMSKAQDFIQQLDFSHEGQLSVN